MVWLSERNVLALLAMLQDPSRQHWLGRHVEAGIRLIVIPQSDEEHYRGRPAGAMSTSIEQGIRLQQQRPRSGGKDDN